MTGLAMRTGPWTAAAPVVELAPMAGVTNAAYRQLCREQHEAGGGTDGLFVCEMITSRGIVAGDRKTMEMLQFDPGETTRSVQLYGVDPATMADATAILCERFAVGHVDLNFGCPVPKVTRKGGGAALPWKRDRLRAILRAVVAAARPYGVPVTMKTRVGIDDAHQTYLDAGTIAEEEGCASIALHGRTAQQSYSGQADWSTIAKLKEHVSIPVLGNGDVWEAEDARRMLDQTGADGVVVGRGCLGRPWLFHDLAVALQGSGSDVDADGRALPTSGEVAVTIRRHAELLAGLQTDPEHGERRALTDLRKHMAWYLKGYPVGGDTRRALAMVSSFAELDAALAGLDPDLAFPVTELGTPRGRQGAPKAKVALPEHWLDDASGAALDLDDDEHVSGG
jgi:nifR3 family TIM-barrel protein